jgi:endonuclease III related protein
MSAPFVGVPPPRRRPRASRDARIEAIWGALHGRFGPRRWWPAESPFEVIVGAILTQNTAWRNVERAIGNLRRARALSPAAVLGMRTDRLQRLLRPSGYFRLKARRLREAVGWFEDRFGSRIGRLAREPFARARRSLLGVRGVGPETADSILNYAAGRRTFVADLYSRRVAVRHGLLPRGADYETTRRFFLDRIRKDLYVTQELHALLVAVGNRHCRARPRCQDCPLEALLPPGGPLPF